MFNFIFYSLWKIYYNVLLTSSGFYFRRFYSACITKCTHDNYRFEIWYIFVKKNHTIIIRVDVYLIFTVLKNENKYFKILKLNNLTTLLKVSTLFNIPVNFMLVWHGELQFGQLL